MRLAAGSGFRVLSARASAAEVRLTFAVLADLLDDVDLAVIERLAPVQRVALDRALLRGNAGPPTDERVAAAAFLSVLEVLAQRSTVLVAIDDLQWLDSPSRAVIGFAVRRLKGPIGIVATARTGAGDHPGEPWLHLPDPDRLAVLRLRPLSLGALDAVIKARLGRTLPRPVITQIHKVSAGNPLYAVELARNLDADLSPGPLSMPESLNALVRHRPGTVSDETSALLLAAACAANPTVAELALATQTSVERVVNLLEGVETQGIVVLDGHRVRFAHPLLGRSLRGVPAARRAGSMGKSLYRRPGRRF